MPLPSDDEIAPPLLIPPLNAETTTVPAWEGKVPSSALPPTKMPCPVAEIVPELPTPPAKVDTTRSVGPVARPPTTIALAPTEIVPELLIPPANAASLEIRIASLVAVMLPALEMEPLIVLPTMKIPLGSAGPAVAMMPAELLTTLPLIVELLIRMQEIPAALLIPPRDTPT